MYKYQIFTILLFILLASDCPASGEPTDEFESVAEIIKSCEVCHGKQGASVQPQYPILAGQEFYYLYVQLKDFKSGLREEPIMGPLASALDRDQMQLVAKYFSEQSWPKIDYVADDQRTRSALTVVAAGQCVACHLGAFLGNSRVPRLAGQHRDYLVKTLLDFKTRARKNSPSKNSLIASFDDEQLVDVAYYLSALGD